MLESMIKSPVATRAEVSDVANAIMDGTDALMLSEETTLGQFPIEAVTVMSNVANELEANYPEREITRLVKSGEVKISDSITSSVVKTSHDVGAKAIIAFTGSGFTARMISRYKPACPILALSPDDETTKKMSLVFGCIAETVPKHNDLNEVMSMVREVCLSKKIVKKGDKVVVAGGVPFNTKGLQTNMMLVLEI
jgi:pyruvate kinase